jgi:hypothetical protein
MTAERHDAYCARRIETAAEAAVAAAKRDDAVVLLVFRGVAVEIGPEHDAASAIAAHDAAIADIVDRETEHPLLRDLTPERGDVVETLEDDHFTRIPKGTIRLVVATTEREGPGAPTAIAVRFATRSVDYDEADYAGLRHVRLPRR